jgi:hypothetical protein
MCGIDLFDDRAYQLPTAVVDSQQNRVKPQLRAVA